MIASAMVWLGDLFWSGASSLPVIGVAAIVLAAALVVGWFPFGAYLPVIGPYVKVARLVAFLAFGLLCALIDRRAADARAEIAQLRRDLSFTEMQLANAKATADDKAALAEASAQAAAGAQMKADTYAQFVASRPAIVGCTLDAGDVARLRDIQPRRAIAVPARRSVAARLRGFGRRAGDAGG